MEDLSGSFGRSSMLFCAMSQKAPEGPEKLCTGPCGKVKPIGEFYFHKQNNRHRPDCKDCVNGRSKKAYEADSGRKLVSNKKWQGAHPEKARGYTRKSVARFAPGGYAHRMSHEEWEWRWQEQDGRCYLCGLDLTEAVRICIEHDHRCCGPSRSCERCRRGLSCINCNSVVGLAREDPGVLHRIADNLQAAQFAVELAIAEHGRGLDSWTDSRRKYETQEEAHQAQLQAHSRWASANREQVNAGKRARHARRKVEAA